MRYLVAYAFSSRALVCIVVQCRDDTYASTASAVARRDAGTLSDFEGSIGDGRCHCDGENAEGVNCVTR